MKLKTSTKIFALFSILWMVLIFAMSSQSNTESTSISEKVTGAVVDAFSFGNKPQSAEEAGFGGSDEKIIKDIEDGLVPKNDWLGINRFEFKTAIRKMAHFFLYTVLGILVSLTVFSYRTRPGLAAFLVSFGVCAVYGILDEIHQVFVPGRAGLVKDAVIDGGGSLFGILLVILAFTVVKRIKNRA